MLDFRFFGIPVVVQPFHWVILGVLGFLNINPTGRSGLIAVALFMLAGFISILIHEMGHALTGRRFGARPEVVLHGMGGVAMFPGGRFTRMQSFLVTAAGPGIQLILAGLAYAVLVSGVLPDTQITNFFFYLYLVSLFWAVFNCVPVFPLDGGQMLAAILGERRAVLTYQIGMGAAILVGIWGLMVGFIFVAFFMGYMAYQNYQMMLQHKNHWR